jgi:hypothetical protein
MILGQALLNQNKQILKNTTRLPKADLMLAQIRPGLGLVPLKFIVDHNGNLIGFKVERRKARTVGKIPALAAQPSTWSPVHDESIHPS